MVATLILVSASVLGLPSGSQAGIRCVPAALDFGDRGHNEKPVETLSLTNTGTAPVSVRRLESSCSCITLQPSSIPNPIPPGGTVAIEVRMGSGRAMGTLEKRLTIHTDDPRSPTATVPVRMRVFDGYSMEPRELRYDGVFGGEPVVQSVEVRSPGSRAGKAISLVIDGVVEASGRPSRNPHFSGTVVDVKGGKRIDLTLQPTHPEGRIWANLEARLDGKPLVIPVVGEMYRWIKVVPNYLNFNRVSSDDPGSYHEEVKLSSTDGREFRIVGMKPEFRVSNPPGMQLELSLVGSVAGAAAKEHVIRAEILPPFLPRPVEPPTGSSGSFSGQVVVETDHPEKPKITLSFFGFVAPPKT